MGPLCLYRKSQTWKGSTLNHNFQNFPNLKNPVDPGRVEDGHPGGVPASPGQTSRGGFHPHDGGGAQVLAPDLGRVVPDCEEVFWVERISVNGCNSAVVARVKHPKDQPWASASAPEWASASNLMCQPLPAFYRTGHCPVQCRPWTLRTWLARKRGCKRPRPCRGQSGSHPEQPTTLWWPFQSSWCPTTCRYANMLPNIFEGDHLTVPSWDPVKNSWPVLPTHCKVYTWRRFFLGPLQSPLSIGKVSV